MAGYCSSWATTGSGVIGPLDPTPSSQLVLISVFLPRVATVMHYCQADTTADKKDRELLQGTLMALANRLGYRLVMSLANYKYAGTAALIR